MPILSHLSVLESKYFYERLIDVNIIQFNNENSKTLFTFCSEPIDYDIWRKRMGHHIVHAIKQIEKHLNSNFDLNKDMKSNFCNASQLDKFTYNTFPL